MCNKHPFLPGSLSSFSSSPNWVTVSLIAPIARTGATLRREHRPPGFALAAGEAPADAEAVAPADLVLATTAGPNPTARAA
jgi:hypothetical protein